MMLWAVALVPLLWVGHRILLRRQQRAAERFADKRLFEQLVVTPPSWQRALPVALYLAGILFLAVGLARPIAAIPLPVNRAAVIIAIDTSKSMVATDVSPTRLEAARRAAREFVGIVPRSTKIGIVAFSEYGTVLLAPSTDRTALLEAIDRLQPQSATSVGGGILEAVRVLPGRARLLGERLDRLARQGGGRPTPPAPSTEPPPSLDEIAPGAIIMFSDGVNNFGPDPFEAAALARDGKVRIFTIGMGTSGGTVMRIDGQLVLVPFDSSGLERIAQITDGRYFSSAGQEELRRVYRQLGRIIGWERTRMEISFLLVGAAGIVMLTGGALSLMWFRRVP
ncbi:MAG: VWA domain-containing protein, partial [bacterium]